VANRLEEGLAPVPSLPLKTSRESFGLLAPLTNMLVVTTDESSTDTAAGEPVYSSADAEVRPPALMRPQLPTLPAPTARTSYYEILVDENGAAAAVKVVSPVRRYYDGMLVAAAKAWTFKPAVRDGRPVKYWIRVPINVADGW
jgi:Gram-negative bacterial TonB protein C-terminal